MLPAVAVAPVPTTRSVWEYGALVVTVGAVVSLPPHPATMNKTRIGINRVIVSSLRRASQKIDTTNTTADTTNTKTDELKIVVFVDRVVAVVCAFVAINP